MPRGYDPLADALRWRGGRSASCEQCASRSSRPSVRMPHARRFPRAVLPRGAADRCAGARHERRPSRAWSSSAAVPVAWIAAAGLRRAFRKRGVDVLVVDTGMPADAPRGTLDAAVTTRHARRCWALPRPTSCGAPAPRSSSPPNIVGWQGEGSRFLHAHGEIGTDIGGTPFYKYLVLRGHRRARRKRPRTSRWRPWPPASGASRGRWVMRSADLQFHLRLSSRRAGLRRIISRRMRRSSACGA